MSKMHKWEGKVAEMPIHYPLFKFDYEYSDRAPFRGSHPDPMHFQIYALLPYPLLRFQLNKFSLIKSRITVTRILPLWSRGQVRSPLLQEF